jgi:hypothetical protein
MIELSPVVPSVFLAGGITGCPDWQSSIIPDLSRKLNKLSWPSSMVIINPRRVSWDMKDSEGTAREQIRWEHHYLQQADIISFWFPEETLCPITLFELGKKICRPSNTFGLQQIPVVGVHPRYVRRLDIEVQCSLERSVPVVYSLKELVSAVVNEVYNLA